MNIQTSVSTIYGDWNELFAKQWNKQIEVLKNKFGSAIQDVLLPVNAMTDVPIIYVEAKKIVEVLSFCKSNSDFSYDFLADLTATDELELAKPSRFEVVYQLLSSQNNWRIRIKVKLKENEPIASIHHVWAGANWAEREVWDMFGIRFEGHPNLRRILMHKDWVGHPLRKDYGLKDRQMIMTTAPIDENQLMPTEDIDDDLWDGSRVLVNIGPTHPAMHGALRMVARVNGETIEDSYCEFGYTHRAKEKLGENLTYHKFIVYTDRLNYCSAMLNNMTYAMSVERLLGVQVPDRAVWLRMICSEIARITDHLICVGINAVDLGAFSFFLYGFHQREEAYTLIEKLCGARLTTSYSRIGGLMHDAPEGWEKETRDWIKRTRKTLAEMNNLLTTNKIWRDRTQGVSVFNREQCIAYSVSGPIARAAGIDRDIRRDFNPMFYGDVQFEVPTGTNADIFDRYLVRFEEMRQSLRIIEQCLDKMKKGPIWADDKRIKIPEKDVVHNTMEGMIHHFKVFMTGFEVPKGEAYTPFEGANGELGFYIVSNGKSSAHRMRIRSPSFWNYQTLSEMTRGEKIADVVAALGSINIIAGELDR